MRRSAPESGDRINVSTVRTTTLPEIESALKLGKAMDLTREAYQLRPRRFAAPIRRNRVAEPVPRQEDGEDDGFRAVRLRKTRQSTGLFSSL